MNLSDFVHIVFDWLQILSGECSYYKCCILNIPANFNFDLAQYLEPIKHNMHKITEIHQNQFPET